MGSKFDKAKGLAEEGLGKAKKVAGDVTNNAPLYNDGVVQQRKGEARQFVGKTKDAIKKATDL